MTIKFQDAVGLRVRYLETEGEGGIPLIILHGWGSSINSWTDVMQSLEKSGAKVFMPDLPGFGETPEPKTPWALDDYIAFVKSFSRAMGVTTFYLAGHSFGGQIAIGYSAKYPNDVQGLILMAAARILRRKKIRVGIFLIFATVGKAVFTIPFLCALKPVVQKIWSKLTGETDYYQASALMKKTMQLVVGEEVGPKLEEIKTNTLILWGARDNVTPLADAKIIHEKIPNSSLHVFEGVGHDLNFKKPSGIAQKIFEFMHQQQ
jgi:pimeloyl-ACP methyl ester carboxylesterase